MSKEQQTVGQDQGSTNEPIRWGILGTGMIANFFVTGLKSLNDATVAAVGSRTQATADAFADQYDIPRRHGSYAALAADPEVDVIYVATPHSVHREATILCLEAGKPVLCEKPFAINAGEAEQMVATARARDLFLMEAMWTRFRPAMVKLREVLASGAIGEPRMFMADLGWPARFNPDSRLFAPALGGGALLDAGVYPISLASMVLGPPTSVAGLAHLGTTNVDEQAGIVLGDDTGRLAVLGITIQTGGPHTASIMGTGGHIDIHFDWHRPESFTVHPNRQEPQSYDFPLTEGNGYQYEAMEVMRCLRAGERESPTLPLDETLAIMRTMDRLREIWGVRYPADDETLERVDVAAAQLPANA
jgi:predicted dehydrogenase